MRLFKCCCSWSFVIGKKQVYGPIYAMGIGSYPDALATTQRMMAREEFEESYADCAMCADGDHHHSDVARVTAALAGRLARA